MPENRHDPVNTTTSRPQPDAAPVEAPPVSPAENPTYILKIVEHKQTSLVKIQIGAADLMDLITRHSADGWQVNRVLSGKTFPFLGSDDAFMVIFEKEPPEGSRI